jgi:hypothetical protein
MILPPPRAERVNTPWTRKRLSFDPLIELIHDRAQGLPDQRQDPDYPLADAIMSALALFSLKDPSLLAFQARRNDENMKTLFRIMQIPSDTQMREMLDPVEPDWLRPFFKDIFQELQRGKALESFVFHEGYYLLAIDGTEYFSSDSIHCPCCLCRESKTGKKTFYHQMLSAVLVKPGKREVIPLAPEPIVKQDGSNKNDCERNAGKRLLEKIRQDHPRLPIIVVEDGLASNAPHIRLLKQLDMRFLLIVKQDDHEHLFEECFRAHDEDRATASATHTRQNRSDLRDFLRPRSAAEQVQPGSSRQLLMYSEYAPDGTSSQALRLGDGSDDHRGNAPTWWKVAVLDGRSKTKPSIRSRTRAITLSTTMGMDSRICRSCSRC